MLRFLSVFLLAIAVSFTAYAAPEPAAASAPAAAQSSVPQAAATQGEPARSRESREAPPAVERLDGAVSRLRRFLANTHTAQADFTQEVLDKNGRRAQMTSGVMHFSRPGKFRWTYLKPYEQIIVGDGARFWLYDVDLSQVTVQKLDAALGSSPAALLAGNHEIEREFELKDIDCRQSKAAGQTPAPKAAGENLPICEEGGLEWLEARPKVRESNFERIRMALNAQTDLVVMELRDTFGHVTVLHFFNMQHNPRLPAALFRFEPPQGVDVVGEQ